MKEHRYRHELEELWNHAKHWKGHWLYECHDDPRLIVPKRNRKTGWTVNLAHHASVPLMLGAIFALLAPFGLLDLFHASYRFWVPIILLADVIILCAFCFFMAHPGRFRKK